MRLSQGIFLEQSSTKGNRYRTLRVHEERKEVVGARSILYQLLKVKNYMKKIFSTE